MDPDTPSSPGNNSQPSQAEVRGLMKFWQELKRRKVVRVAAVYAVVAWLVIQIAVSTFPRLLIPGWAESLVIMCVILGFPVALILAWAFELTLEGIKTTKVARSAGSDMEEATASSKKRNWFVYQKLLAEPSIMKLMEDYEDGLWLPYLSKRLKEYEKYKKDEGSTE